MTKKKLTKRQNEIMNAILDWDYKEQFMDIEPDDTSKWQRMRIAVPPVDDRVFKNLISVLETNWKVVKKLVLKEATEQFNIYNVYILVEEWKQIYSNK